MKKERRTLRQKLKNAHEWLFEIDALVEKVEEEEQAPSFHPKRWAEVAYNIRLARKVLGKAQSHARALERNGLKKKGLR